MAKPSKGSAPKRGRPGGFRHHERPADPAAESDRPLEPKARHGTVTSRGREPGAGSTGVPADPPHLSLITPVGEPAPLAASDPFEPHPEAEDPPPPVRYPCPGPEPDQFNEPDLGEEGASRSVTEE